MTNKGTTGSIIRTVKCSHCDRMYRGGERTVDKLISMHMKREHGLVPNAVDSAYVKVVTKDTQKDQIGVVKRVPIGEDLFDVASEALNFKRHEHTM